jgi:hypothetical protein
MYYSNKVYKLQNFRKSKTKKKKYDAILLNKETGRTVAVPFGDTRYENYHDKTGLNLYPHLLHGDKVRRRAYRARHSKDLRKDYFSPGYFSYFYLW